MTGNRIAIALCVFIFLSSWTAIGHGQSPLAPHATTETSPDDQGLKRSILIQEATSATVATDGSQDYLRAARIFDDVLPLRKSGWVLDWVTAAVAHAHLGNRDQAFRYLDDAIDLGLELSVEALDESLTRYGAKPKLVEDPRYSKLMEKLSKLRDEWHVRLAPKANGLAGPNLAIDELKNAMGQMQPREFYDRLTHFNSFPQPTRLNHWIQFEYPATDKLMAPYYVFVPPHYDGTRPTGLIVYLHGGIVSRPKFPSAESKSFIVDNPFLPIAQKHNLLVLCPAGMKEMKWWDRVGIEAIQGELAATKKLFNVDDSAVWLTGHSNGGTGALAMGATSPSPFASLYSLNGPPVSTRLGNLQSRPIYSLYSGKDGIFPINQMRTYWKAAIKENANWMFRELPGHDHDYSSYIEYELPKLSEHMLATRRPPLPCKIVWEAKAGQVSSCDWLQVDEVTPGKNRASWHEDVSYTLTAPQPGKPDVSQEVRYGSEIGKIKATFNSNTFDVETSQIGAFSLLLHPQLIDFRYPVKVVVNGKEHTSRKIEMDSETMWKTFDQNGDRQRIWCASFRIEVTEL